MKDEVYTKQIVTTIKKIGQTKRTIKDQNRQKNKQTKNKQTKGKKKTKKQ